jgi:hypothetical protein
MAVVVVVVVVAAAAAAAAAAAVVVVVVVLIFRLLNRRQVCGVNISNNSCNLVCFQLLRAYAIIMKIWGRVLLHWPTKENYFEIYQPKLSSLFPITT